MGKIDSSLDALTECMQSKIPTFRGRSQGLWLCSLWQERLQNPECYPFKILMLEGGNHQVCILNIILSPHPFMLWLFSSSFCQSLCSKFPRGGGGSFYVNVPCLSLPVFPQIKDLSKENRFCFITYTAGIYRLRRQIAEKSQGEAGS